MEKHFFFVQTSPPSPFSFNFLPFEAFPQVGKDSAQIFYNYKYQNVFWSALLYPLLHDLVDVYCSKQQLFGVADLKLPKSGFICVYVLS